MSEGALAEGFRGWARVVGKEAIRAYWTRQWAEFDPHVELLQGIEGKGGVVRVQSEDNGQYGDSGLRPE